MIAIPLTQSLNVPFYEAQVELFKHINRLLKLFSVFSSMKPFIAPSSPKIYFSFSGLVRKQRKFLALKAIKSYENKTTVTCLVSWILFNVKEYKNEKK